MRMKAATNPVAATAVPVDRVVAVVSDASVIEALVLDSSLSSRSSVWAAVGWTNSIS